MRLILILVVLLPMLVGAKPGELDVKLLADNVYQHISYAEIKPYGLVPASGLVVVNGNNQAILIDTPWTDSDTEKLVAWFKRKGITITTSISTHFHQDRAGGIGYLTQQGVATYASKHTNQLLLAQGDASAEHSFATDKPFTVFADVEAVYPGAGHSMDNIVVWLPKQKLLFGGCLVRALNAKTLGFTGDGDISQWSQSISNIMLQYPNIKTVVPGHGAIGDSALLHHTQALALKAKQK